MAYEVFDQKATKLVTPMLTISRGKTIYLNPGASDLLRESGGKFIHLLWDASARRIALRPLARPDSIAFKLTNQSGERRGMTVSAAAFLRHIGWNATKSKTFEVAWNEKEKLLEASLPAKFLEH